MANRTLLRMKYARVVERFAGLAGIALDEALGFFYSSVTHEMMDEGVSDLHCMSDAYLAEDLLREWEEPRAAG